MNKLATLALLSVFIIGHVSAQNNKLYLETISKIRYFLDQNDIENAYKESENAISINSKSYEGYFWYGMAYLYDNKNKMALEKFKIAFEIEENADTAFYFGISNANAGNIENAIFALKKVIALCEAGNSKYERLPDAYERLGRIYLFQVKDTEESIQYLEKALQLNSNVYFCYHLGVAYSRSLRFDEAMKVFQEAQNIIEKNKIDDKWIIDNIAWGIEMTQNKTPMEF